MAFPARHTKIVEAIQTRYGILVREDYHGHPSSESNLYLVDLEGVPLWFAEQASAGDPYANLIRLSEDNRLNCTSWDGFDCEIDLQDGRLISASFTK